MRLAGDAAIEMVSTVIYLATFVDYEMCVSSYCCGGLSTGISGEFAFDWDFSKGHDIDGYLSLMSSHVCLDKYYLTIKGTKFSSLKPKPSTPLAKTLDLYCYMATTHHSKKILVEKLPPQSEL